MNTQFATAKREIDGGEGEMILAYVPEAEHLTHGEALKLANDRDRAAANALATDAEEILQQEIA